MGPVNGGRSLKATSRRENAPAFGTNDSSSVEGNLNLKRVVREGEKKLKVAGRPILAQALGTPLSLTKA